MAETLSIFSWNVQSPGKYGGRADPEVLADHLQDFAGHDIFGFCEVLDHLWAEGFKKALEESEQDEFAKVLGSTGWGGDKLLILYRKRTLEATGEPEELLDIKEGGGRAPLVVPLSLRSTGTQFQFMMNHLHSSATSKRLTQVRKLNEWAQNQQSPIIAAGDYNFFDVRPDRAPQNDAGFRLLTQDDVFRWVQPAQLVRTQFDPHYDIDWILDFVFVTGEARDWAATSDILLADKPPAYFLNDAMTDHRPIRADFQV